jgi:prefoldin subunit 5
MTNEPRTPRSVGQNGATVTLPDLPRRVAALETEVSAIRSEVVRLKETLGQLEKLLLAEGLGKLERLMTAGRERNG